MEEIFDFLENLPHITEIKREKVKITRGVYYLFKEEELLYIGQSNEIERRIVQHAKNFDFDYFSMLSVPEVIDLNDVEAHEILKYQPVLNRYIPKNNLYCSIRTYLEEKAKIIISGDSVRISNLEREGIKPTYFKGVAYFKRDELEEIFYTKPEIIIANKEWEKKIKSYIRAGLI